VAGGDSIFAGEDRDEIDRFLGGDNDKELKYLGNNRDRESLRRRSTDNRVDPPPKNWGFESKLQLSPIIKIAHMYLIHFIFPGGKTRWRKSV
jgi:hypothetical protein